MVEWIEQLGALAGYCCVAVSAVSLREAIQDRRIVRARALEGPIRTIAEHFVIDRQLHVLEAIAISIVTTAVWYLPHPGGVALRLTARWALTATAVLILTRSLIDCVTRHHMIQRRKRGRTPAPPPHTSLKGEKDSL